MSEGPNWDTAEDLFKELDDRNEWGFIATALGNFRRALMREDFTRREAARLVELHAKYVYDMALDDASWDRDVDPDDD